MKTIKDTLNKSTPQHKDRLYELTPQQRKAVREKTKRYLQKAGLLDETN